MSIRKGIGGRVKPDNLGEFLCEDGEFGEQYPGIWEVLARQMYEGNPIKVGRLILYCEPGRVYLCLCDKESGQVAFCSGSSVDEALVSLEGQLQAGTADWRKDKRAGGYSR